MLTKYQRGNNADFSAGICTVNVSRRIPFCIAQLLSQSQSICKGHLVTEHLFQNEVSSTVQNTSDRIQIICSEAGMQRTHNRDRTANTCFKEEVAVVFLCNLQQDVSFFCNQLLIGGRNALASLQTAADKFKCRIDTAHAFCNIADFWVLQDDIDVMDNLQDVFNVHRITSIFFNLFLILIEQFHDTRAYDTVAQYGNLFFLLHNEIPPII